MKTPRTLADLKRDPRVARVWREEDTVDFDGNRRRSWWVQLAEGWTCALTGASGCHEPTITQLCIAVSMAEPPDDED